MVQIGLKWSETLSNSLDEWSEVVQNGSKWPVKVQNSSTWLEMT
jgi:hypothetical protein